MALLAAIEAPTSLLEVLLLHIQVLWILVLLIDFFLLQKTFVRIGSHHVSRHIILDK